MTPNILDAYAVGIIAGTGIACVIIAANWFRGRARTPQERVDLMNREDATRGCHKCKSTKSHYDVGKDAIVCDNCGSTERCWALAHPELSL